MTRSIPVRSFFLLFLLLSPAVGAQEPASSSAPASVQTELRLERRLLSLDLVSYNETRERERRAREQVSAVLGRLDQALASDAMSLGNLETLRDQLAAAREAAHTAEVRLDSQLASLQERMRRIALLEGDGGGPARPADALTGRWRVTVLPQNFAATFDLRLNGTVVSGTYQIDGGGSGSFRGSLAGGKLRLERIDAQGGADSLWEGTLGTNRIDDGTWGTHELVTGQPPRGTWTAVRESGR
jgi:TolA-binding protein